MFSQFSHSTSGRTHALDDVKRDLITVTPPNRTAADEKLPPSEHKYPHDESSGRSSGANTTESDTIERLMMTPVSDPKKSAIKLTRMGYPAEAAVVNRSTPPPAPLAAMRFGAIKTLMQTFRSKT